MLKAKKSAFTLVEILVVILIIGLLFVFLVPKIDSATDKSRETGIKTDFRSYQTAFEAVAREHGGLGTNALLNGAAGADGATAEKIVNQYLDPALRIDADGDGTDEDTLAAAAGVKTMKNDPWNNKYEVIWISATAEGESKNNGTLAVYTKGKDAKGAWTVTVKDSVANLKTADAAATDLTAKTADKNVLASVATSTNANKADDYILCTTCVDGEIFSATQGFTTNIKAF